jgi:hypothetical protein
MTTLKYKCAITTIMQSFRIYAIKIGGFFSIATENARKAVIEFQKLIFLGEDLQALKGHCNLRLLQFK